LAIGGWPVVGGWQLMAVGCWLPSVSCHVLMVSGWWLVGAGWCWCCWSKTSSCRLSRLGNILCVFFPFRNYPEPFQNFAMFLGIEEWSATLPFPVSTAALSSETLASILISPGTSFTLAGVVFIL
jgi:hypothetical protein